MCGFSVVSAFISWFWSFSSPRRSWSLSFHFFSFLLCVVFLLGDAVVVDWFRCVAMFTLLPTPTVMGTNFCVCEDHSYRDMSISWQAALWSYYLAVYQNAYTFSHTFGWCCCLLFCHIKYIWFLRCAYHFSINYSAFDAIVFVSVRQAIFVADSFFDLNLLIFFSSFCLLVSVTHPGALSRKYGVSYFVYFLRLKSKTVH